MHTFDIEEKHFSIIYLKSDKYFNTNICVIYFNINTRIYLCVEIFLIRNELAKVI